MKLVWLRANFATWVVSRLTSNILSRFEGDECDGLHAHRTQAGNQEGCREPPAIDFAVYLVRRLVDALRLQHPRKLFVANAAPYHLFLYQPLRLFFPPPVRLSRQPTTFLWEFFHRSPSTLFEPLFFWCHDSLTGNFGRIRLTSSGGALHVLCKPFFCENRMLTITLQPSLPTRRAATATQTTSLTSSRSQTPDGGAK